MNSRENRRVQRSKALVVATVIAADPGKGTPVVCKRCRGPARLCGGVQRCTGGPSSASDLRWLTAVRAVYAGLVLTRTVAAPWGGALLRFARQLGAGESPPPAMAQLAAKHADPRCAAPGDVVADLALAYVQHGDLDRLSELSRCLREARAPWLLELGSIGPRAALSSPLDPARFALLAVLCDDCAHDAVVPIEERYAEVETYDAAIRCPSCGGRSAHPLPGVTMGEPHPVGRCLASAGAAPRSCRTHEGRELDEEGLCVEGRKAFDRAVLEVAKIGRASSPFERDLVESLVRARRQTLNAKVDDAALARSVVTSPALMPFFAALAATNPDAGRDLAQIAGAPLDTAAADPSVLAAMSAGGGLAGLIATGKAAVERLRESLGGKPTALPPRPSRKRNRRKDGQR